MKRTRASIKRYIENSDSQDESPSKKLVSPQSSKTEMNKESSSSESDIENYLQRPDKLDLNSEFFNLGKNYVPKFNKIENEIFTGITRLSESDSSSECGSKINYLNMMPQQAETSSAIYSKKLETKFNKRKLSDSDLESDLDVLQEPTTKLELISKLTFGQFQDYTKKMEEAKKFVEKYKAQQRSQDNKTDITNILAAGETKVVVEQCINPMDLHSSDFESTDEESENWEVIKPNKLMGNQDFMPKKNVEITIGMPDAVRKKKGIDLLAAMKRRLNRIRKENQILVHKVHLLCWMAHGNYVNCQINDMQVLGLALSLLPSEQCYPSERTDLGYLEQIVQWYKRTVKCVEKPQQNNGSLLELLQQQISKREASSKKMLVFIFVAVLRSLGIQCRLIISLEVEPLRPPISELHSLATKVEEKCRSRDIKSSHNKNNEKSSKTVEKKPSTSKISDKKRNIKENIKTDNKLESNNDLAEPKPEKCSKIGDNKNVLAEKAPSSGRCTRSSAHIASIGKSLENCSTSVKKSKAIPKENGKLQKHSVKSVRKTEISNSKMPKTRSVTSTSDKFDNETIQKNVIQTSKQKPAHKEDTDTTNSKKSGIKSGQSQNSADLRKHVRTSLDAESVKSKKSLSKVKIQQVDRAYCSSSDEECVIPQLDGAGDKKNKRPNLNKLKGAAISKKSLKKDDSESEFDINLERNTISKDKKRPNLRNLSECKKKVYPSKQVDVRNDIIGLIKGRIKEQKNMDWRKKVKKRKTRESSDSDSDYLSEVVIKKHVDSEDDFKPKTKVKSRIPGKIALLAMEVEKKKRIVNDYWVEVFLEAEEKWISADIVYGQVHCVKELYQRANHPVSYVLAWNNDNTLKDVTQRYCENFNTATRKLRIDSKWWNESLKPFLGRTTARDKEEDEDLARQQLDQPLPKSISEYKNHPLYVLKRHLLKFEALYPPDPPTLGFIRGEAVYARGCVYTLHSRDIWLKQAKVVKLGEQPYKIVKARPKYDKLSNKMITDQMLEIFGLWQTEDYVPPTAENGIVPRNAFGNVDLFKPCMLPFGTVHLKLPGLAKVAKKLNVDCAPAVVGFEFHSGWSVPTIDGFVVCKEYEEELVSAWEKEQADMIRKEQEKSHNRVYGNWRRLIKGLLIRERLKAKYDFGTPSVSGTAKEKTKKTKAAKYCTKKA